MLPQTHFMQLKKSRSHNFMSAFNIAVKQLLLEKEQRSWRNFGSFGRWRLVWMHAWWSWWLHTDDGRHIIWEREDKWLLMDIAEIDFVVFGTDMKLQSADGEFSSRSRLEMRGKQPLREEIPHVLLLTQVCDCTALWPMVVTDAPRPPASSSSSTRRVRCNEYSLQKRKDGYMPGESFLMDLIGISVMYSWHVAMLRESVRNVWTLWFTCHSGSQKDGREVCPGSVSLLRAILQRKCRHTERKKPSITIQVVNPVANTRLPQHWVSHIANVNHVTTEMLNPTAPNIPLVFSAREMSWRHRP